MTSRRRIGAAILLGLVVGGIGFLINMHPIRSGFSVDLLFGAIGTYFLMRVGDRLSVVVAGLLTASATIVLWDQPWTFIVLVGEFAFCLWAKHSRQIDPLFAAPIYWLFLGVPQIVAYYTLLLDIPLVTSLALGAKQGVNGLANAALGSLLASLVMAAVPWLRSRRSRSMRIAIAEVLVAFTIIPVVLYSAFAAQGYEAERDASALSEVRRAANDAAERADTLFADLRREAILISRLLLGPGFDSLAAGLEGVTLPFALDRLLVADTNRVMIAALNRSGATRFPSGAATMPEVAAGDGLLVRMDDTGLVLPALSVALTGPENNIDAWALAMIDVERFAAYVLPPEAIPNIRVSVVAADGRPIVSSGAMPTNAGPEATIALADVLAPPIASDDIGINAAQAIDVGGWQVRAVYDTSTYEAAYRLRAAEFLGSMLIIAAVGMAISAMAARLITIPLERLTRSIADPEPDRPSAQPGQAGITEVDAMFEALDAARTRAAHFTRHNHVLAQRLQSLEAHTPVKVYAAERRDGRYVVSYASTGLEAVGLSMAEGDPYEPVPAAIHPEDRDRIARERLRFPLERRFGAEYRIVRADGQVGWISEVAVLVEGAASMPAEIVGVVMDVTARKLADLQMQQSAKLINLGQMATGLAHELNQPLNVIRMAAENAMMVMEDPRRADTAREVVSRKLVRIEAQVQRAARLIDDLRIFGRAPDGTTEPFAVEDAVRIALSMVDAQMRIQDIQLVATYDAEGAMVLGAAQRLEQVVINVVLNALDAIVAGQRRAVAIEAVVVPGVIGVAVARRGEIVEIEVFDNGGGIATEILDRIFEPFVTTKPPGLGTGLGLSLSYRIVAEMGGAMTARNAAGGAVFRVELPLLHPGRVVSDEALAQPIAEPAI